MSPIELDKFVCRETAGTVSQSNMATALFFFFFVRGYGFSM